MTGVHVALSRRLCRVKAEDRQVDTMCYVKLFYPKIVVSNVLGPSGIVVF
jgi:hypothetical protein